MAKRAYPVRSKNEDAGRPRGEPLVEFTIPGKPGSYSLWVGSFPEGEGVFVQIMNEDGTEFACSTLNWCNEPA
jgi:hypothetical protein